MVFEKVGKPLKLVERPVPIPTEDQVLVRVLACAVCRTDLHIIDGELPNPKLPLILGHQIVGRITQLGKNVTRLHQNQLVGIPWLGKSCGTCPYCLSERENLCDNALFTGYTLDGGFAEFCVAYADFCFSLHESSQPEHTAPLLCGGFIGYRAYRMTEKAKNIGFYGFGSSAHMLIQIALHEKRHVYVFTRSGDTKGQKLAKQLGACWAGSSEEQPPIPLDAVIIFAPVGELIPKALRAVGKGGIVVCAGIHMSDIPSFPYSDLWGERILRSVANLTRKDGRQLLELAPRVPIETQITVYPLEKVNEALNDLRSGHVNGTAVIGA